MRGRDQLRERRERWFSSRGGRVEQHDEVILRATRGDVQEVRPLTEPAEMPAFGRRYGEDDDAPLAALQSVHRADEDAATLE